MNEDPAWRLIVAVGVTLIFACIGVYIVFKPDRFVRHPPLFWKQADDEARFFTRVVGAILTLVALWIIYDMVWGQR